jgi:hypothetical protein
MADELDGLVEGKAQGGLADAGLEVGWLESGGVGWWCLKVFDGENLL